MNLWRLSATGILLDRGWGRAPHPIATGGNHPTTIRGSG